MAPAIRLAEEGIEVTRVLADSLERRRKTLARWPATRAIFLKPDGSAYMAGERLVQKDLAWSLRQIARHGAKAFYEGAIAERIAADMQANGGLLKAAGLKDYQAILRSEAHTSELQSLMRNS